MIHVKGEYALFNEYLEYKNGGLYWNRFKNFISKRTNGLCDRYEVRVEGNYVGSSKCPLIAYRISIDAPFGVNFYGI